VGAVHEEVHRHWREACTTLTQYAAISSNDHHDLPRRLTDASRLLPHGTAFSRGSRRTFARTAATTDASTDGLLRSSRTANVFARLGLTSHAASPCSKMPCAHAYPVVARAAESWGTRRQAGLPSSTTKDSRGCAVTVGYFTSPRTGSISPVAEFQCVWQH